MKNKIFILILIAAMFGACDNQPIEYRDYEYTSAYFPFQTPARTLVLGNYDQGFNENDNNHRFEIGVVMGGVYQNEIERKVHFEHRPELLANVKNVQAIPEEYFTIETQSPATIAPGSTDGRIMVQLTDAFFQDTLAFAPENEVNYVVPIVITQIENLDTLLRGDPAVDNPDRVNPDDWNSLPKDYTLFGIKYINEYHGHYLRRGIDVMRDSSGNEVENVYQAEYVVKDEVVMATTSGRRSVTLQNTVRRGDQDSPGAVTMEVTFDGDGNGTIRSADGDPYNVSGTATFSPDAGEWGGESRDVITLEYTYTDSANNETHNVKDTLVIRDRAVVFEEFSVELN